MQPDIASTSGFWQTAPTPPSAGWKIICQRYRSKAYSKKYINYLHEIEYDISDLCLVVAVTHEHENAGDDVVAQHLPVVFSPLLDVDDEDLLDPETELYEVVPFHGCVDFSVWPAGPHLLHVEPVLMSIHDILYKFVSCWILSHPLWRHVVPCLMKT